MSNLGNFIWSIADQLRGPYRPNQYGNVILPLTILRRLDCILEPDRQTVRELAARYDNPNRLKIEVKKATGRPFYNTSNYSFDNLLKDADGLADNLADYIDRFSPDVDVFEYFDFKKEILALEKAELLREVITSFKAVDLHPDVVSNADMGDAFEYIIRKFNEAANETSGDHYTPRDAIRLLVDLLFAENDVDLTEAGIVRTLYDPAFMRNFDVSRDTGIARSAQFHLTDALVNVGNTVTALAPRERPLCRIGRSGAGLRDSQFRYTTTRNPHSVGMRIRPDSCECY